MSLAAPFMWLRSHKADVHFSEYFMYLSGVNDTANGSLSPAGNYVIWSSHFRSPGYKEQNPAERAEIKVILCQSVSLVS